MRLRFGQASVKGNDIAKKQHEQSTSVEPTRKAVRQLQGSKTQVPTGTRQEYKGGKGSWKIIAQSQWLRTGDTQSQRRETREVQSPSQEPIPTPGLKQASAIQLEKKAAKKEYRPGVADVPNFPEKAKHQDFMKNLSFCCCCCNKFICFKVKKQNKAILPAWFSLQNQSANYVMMSTIYLKYFDIHHAILLSWYYDPSGQLAFWPRMPEAAAGSISAIYI